MSKVLNFAEYFAYVLQEKIQSHNIGFDCRNKENGVRQGYMGHLINIANNIVTQCEKNNILASFLKNNLSPECLTKWENLVSVQLVEINKIHQTVMMVRSNDIYFLLSFFYAYINFVNVVI